ncbi:MAG TPA: polysaccharide deacetylase family protein [Terriglobales bacterium]|jgi:peptidoglycan/xylan/chitin deacetylase (PgdA/CDA1 family)|nr:polysaccharide deacetylase family protein [Terriglobales bacterium]
MRLVSPLLKHVVYPGLSRAGYLRCAAGGGPAVLTYHGVLPVGYKIVDPCLDGNLLSADSFRRQMRFIRKQHNVISPKEFLLWCEGGHELPPCSVLLTCDDGLRSSLFEMVPILREFDLECLFFVTGASLNPTPTMLWYEELYLMFLAAPESFTLELLEIGLQVEVKQQGKRSSWWELVMKLSQYDLNRRRTLLARIRMQLGFSVQWDAEYRDDAVLSRRFWMLSLAELHQLREAGMSIGAHTLSHPMLSQSSDDVAWNEISECKRNLELALEQEVWALAYPFGNSSSVTSRELEMAKRAGFKAAFLNAGGDFGAQTPKFALPRVHITADMSLAEFEAHISGFHRSLQELFRPASPSAVEGRNA